MFRRRHNHPHVGGGHSLAVAEPRPNIWYDYKPSMAAPNFSAAQQAALWRVYDLVAQHPLAQTYSLANGCHQKAHITAHIARAARQRPASVYMLGYVYPVDEKDRRFRTPKGMGMGWSGMGSDSWIKHEFGGCLATDQDGVEHFIAIDPALFTGPTTLSKALLAYRGHCSVDVKRMRPRPDVMQRGDGELPISPGYAQGLLDTTFWNTMEEQQQARRILRQRRRNPLCLFGWRDKIMRHTGNIPRPEVA